MSSLSQALRAALDHRQDLLAELHAQGTDCYRLFHGSQEGAGGLTIDRYGPQLLVQSFHHSLETAELLDLHQQVNQYMGLELLLVYNDRSRGNSRIDREDTVYRAEPAALEDLIGHEWGLNYRVRGRHAGPVPLLCPVFASRPRLGQGPQRRQKRAEPIRLHLRRRPERGSRWCA